MKPRGLARVPIAQAGEERDLDPVAIEAVEEAEAAGTRLDEIRRLRAVRLWPLLPAKCGQGGGDALTVAGLKRSEHVGGNAAELNRTEQAAL